MASQVLGARTFINLRSGIFGCNLNVPKSTGQSRSCSLISASRKSQLLIESKVRSTASVAAAATTLLSIPASATAITVEDVTDAINKVESVASDVVDKAVVSYDFVKNIVDDVVTASKPVVEASIPYVQKAAQTVFDAASPVASDVASKASQALTDAGVDTSPVYSAAKTAAEVTGVVTSQTGKVLTDATPVAQSTLEAVLAQDPTILGVAAGGLVLLYLLAPKLGSAIAYSARGYAGDLTAPQTLDLLATQDYTLIDIRTDREKAKSGTPSLPRSAQKKQVAIAVEELPGKLRSQLRNSRKVEADLTAIKIAALKRLSKGSKVALLDSNGSIVKQVAKSLSNLGFSNVYVVKDGTDGSSGWVQSQLAMDSYRYSSSEVLSPSRIVSGTTSIFSPRKTTSGGVVDVAPSRRGFLLPGGDE